MSAHHPSVGPAPVPADARLVVLFGGTFDPPHTAHIDQPERVREAIGADHILYIPAARSPFKDRGPEAGDRDRLAMLSLALEHTPCASVSTIELDRAAGGGSGGGAVPSYTIDTIRALRSMLPAHITLRLLIGADQAAQFHRWRDAADLIGLAEPIILLREPHRTADSLLRAMAPHWPAPALDAWRARIAPVEPVEGESTLARALLHAVPRDDEALARLLPGPVLDYIRRRGLYRAG